LRAFGADDIFDTVAQAPKSVAECVVTDGGITLQRVSVYQRTVAELIVSSISDLAGVLKAKGDVAGARQLLQLALAIDQKTLGSDAPATRQVQRSLNSLTDGSTQLKAK